MRLKKICSAKNGLIALSVLLLVCLSVLLLPDLSHRGTPAEEHARYYAGEQQTAFLLAVPQGGYAHQNLLHFLSSQGFPVLVAEHPAHPDPDAATQGSLLEKEAQLLESLSGIKPSEQVWIGFHAGANSLLDQLMTGSKSCKAAVVLSPMLDSQQIDDAIIVNGNYQNQSEWINSLSPQMVRQPILLLTSNGDDIATPYQMTLIYNKFSSDSIIHMGGVYHADQNNVFLSITDSGFHATVPLHSQTMEEILRFVNPLLEQPLEMTALPRLYNLSAVAIPALLLLALAFAIRLAAGYAPQVSFSVEHSPSAVKTSLRISALNTSCNPLWPSKTGEEYKKSMYDCATLAGLLGGWVVYQFSAQAIWMIGCALLIFCLLLPVVSKRLLRSSSGVFESTHTKASPMLLSYGAALAAALSLTIVLMHTFPLPPVPTEFSLHDALLVAAALLLFLLFPRAVVTTLERSRKSSPAALTGLLLSLLLPPLFFLLVIVVLTGNSSLFWAICFAASMTLSCLMAKLSFQLCGSRLHASITAVISALPAFPFLLFLA